MIDIFMQHSIIIKIIFAVLCMVSGWYISRIIDKRNNKMVYVYLKYYHTGNEDNATKMECVSDLFKFSSKEACFNEIERLKRFYNFKLLEFKQLV